MGFSKGLQFGLQMGQMKRKREWDDFQIKRQTMRDEREEMDAYDRMAVAHYGQRMTEQAEGMSLFIYENNKGDKADDAVLERQFKNIMDAEDDMTTLKSIRFKGKEATMTAISNIDGSEQTVTMSRDKMVDHVKGLAARNGNLADAYAKNQVKKQMFNEVEGAVPFHVRKKDGTWAQTYRHMDDGPEGSRMVFTEAGQVPEHMVPVEIRKKYAELDKTNKSMADDSGVSDLQKKKLRLQINKEQLMIDIKREDRAYLKGVREEDLTDKVDRDAVSSANRKFVDEAMKDLPPGSVYDKQNEKVYRTMNVLDPDTDKVVEAFVEDKKASAMIKGGLDDLHDGWGAVRTDIFEETGDRVPLHEIIPGYEKDMKAQKKKREETKEVEDYVNKSMPKQLPPPKRATGRVTARDRKPKPPPGASKLEAARRHNRAKNFKQIQRDSLKAQFDQAAKPKKKKAPTAEKLKFDGAVDKAKGVFRWMSSDAANSASTEEHTRRQDKLYKELKDQGHSDKQIDDIMNRAYLEDQKENKK